MLLKYFRQLKSIKAFRPLAAGAENFPGLRRDPQSFIFLKEKEDVDARSEV
jgi:hypothetical protein